MSVTTIVQTPAAIGVTAIEVVGPFAVAGEYVAMPVQLVGAVLVTLRAPA